MTNDSNVLKHINALVERERELREKLDNREIAATDERQQLKAIEEELDQYWDLLRQRQAAREFGLSPDATQLRSSDVVEGYLS
ncbi:MAG: DUF2630 family protein [Propionibacteriaceae bacterium]|jgi:vacuolar-type H+-ATPase subunit B/Vma2|nr:DUF2630 family protein [Propionibacteriaceae bacterium]